MGNDDLLLYFSKHGNCNLIKLLIPVSDPRVKDSWALRQAALNGHTECVRLLIPVSDPMATDSFALQLAAQYGHTECVRLLIPVCDPRANNSWALRLAAEYGHTEIVKLLTPINYTGNVYVIFLCVINNLQKLKLRLLSIYLYIKQRQY